MASNVGLLSQADRKLLPVYSCPTLCHGVKLYINSNLTFVSVSQKALTYLVVTLCTQYTNLSDPFVNGDSFARGKCPMLNDPHLFIRLNGSHPQYITCCVDIVHILCSWECF